MTITIAEEIQVKKEKVEAFLLNDTLANYPQNLSEGTKHILNLKGKRLRPIATLLAANCFGKSDQEAMSSAVALEVFHNFTLVHDDIMDKADLRRGVVTTHKKFGTPTAILVGDAMLPLAFDLLHKNQEENIVALNASFIKMAMEVMEGQQLDMDFETRNDVTIDEYINMIRLKTSVLFGCCCEIGGIIGGASKEDQKRLYDFGVNVGLAFQVMDDYLDTYGGEGFGKKIGGDILLNKKTFLMLNALKEASPEQKAKIEELYTETNEDLKIESVRNIYNELNIPAIAKAKMDELTEIAFSAVSELSCPSLEKEKLIDLAKLMLKRTT